jgi:hypothetical protein
MPDGKPDLTGVYGNAGLPAGTPMPPRNPEPRNIESYAVRTMSAVERRRSARTAKPLGIPQTYITPYPFQIVQRPNMLVMIFEYPTRFA